MVKITIKQISNWAESCNYDIPDNEFIGHISDKCKIDLSFNKFITLVLKYNILIFEKTKSQTWSFKNKSHIINQIQNCIKISYDDYIINITKTQNNEENNIVVVKQILDKIHIGLKKQLTELYELIDIINEINVENISKQSQVRKKKIINNDIFIEEFSN
jgi:hypothetical protein